MSQALKKIIQLRDAIDDINDLIDDCLKNLEQENLDFDSQQIFNDVKANLDNAYDLVDKLTSDMQKNYKFSKDILDLRK